MKQFKGLLVVLAVAFVIAFLSAGCGTESVTAPPQEPVVVTPIPAPVPAPVVAPSPAATVPAHTYEATLKPTGEFCIKNTGTIPRVFYAYSYRNGSEALIDKQSATVAPGDSFCGQLAVLKCLTQLDLSGTDVVWPKISAGEIAHLILHKGTVCEPDCKDEVTYEWTNTRLVVTSLSDSGSTYGIYKGGSLKSNEFAKTQLPFTFNYPNNGDQLCVKFRHPAVPAVTRPIYWYDGRNGIENDCEDEHGTFYGNFDPPGPNNDRSNVCATPVNHGNDWRYDNDEDRADLFNTTSETVTPAKAEWLENVSGACEVATCRQVEAGAAWHGDSSYRCDQEEKHSCNQPTDAK